MIFWRIGIIVILKITLSLFRFLEVLVYRVPSVYYPGCYSQGGEGGWRGPGGGIQRGPGRTGARGRWYLQVTF